MARIDTGVWRADRVCGDHRHYCGCRAPDVQSEQRAFRSLADDCGARATGGRQWHNDGISGESQAGAISTGLAGKNESRSLTAYRTGDF